MYASPCLQKAHRAARRPRASTIRTLIAARKARPPSPWPLHLAEPRPPCRSGGAPRRRSTPRRNPGALDAYIPRCTITTRLPRDRHRLRRGAAITRDPQFAINPTCGIVRHRPHRPELIFRIEPQIRGGAACSTRRIGLRFCRTAVRSRSSKRRRGRACWWSKPYRCGVLQDSSSLSS